MVIKVTKDGVILDKKRAKKIKQVMNQDPDEHLRHYVTSERGTKSFSDFQTRVGAHLEAGDLLGALDEILKRY